jgi:MoxR-like ATPase
VSEPFLVMATQNPIETEGVYPLPEAQVDRFMMKVVVRYPSESDEFVIVERMTGTLTPVKAVVTAGQLVDLRREAAKVYVDPSLIQYAVRLATATREPGKFGIPDIAKYIMYGASPRASINLIVTGRALAFIRGRSYVIPQDVVDMALDVMRHRLVLSYEAVSDGVTSDMILQRILEVIPAPAQPLQSHADVSTKS